MFTFNERDLHRMPPPARTHLPIKQYIADSGILDDGYNNNDEDNTADPTLLRLPAPSLRGTFKEAYRLLTKLVSVIGWDELLKARSQVFVMEEEYRMQKTGGPEPNGVDPDTPAINGPEGEDDDNASTKGLHSARPSVNADQTHPAIADLKDQEDRGRMSVPQSPIPTIKVSSESDGERERLVAAGVLSEKLQAEAESAEQNSIAEEGDGAEPLTSDLQRDAAGVEKPANAAADEDTPASATSNAHAHSAANLSFSNKRLCERWLDNLFMVSSAALSVSGPPANPV